MGAEIIRGVSEQDLPLCPATDSALHRTAVAALDAVYNAGEKDGDGLEFISPDVAVVYEALHKRLNDRMWLYRATTSLPHPSRGYVEAYYFRCMVCGFTLPAVERSRP
jgi:hypothetical protein